MLVPVGMVDELEASPDAGAGPWEGEDDKLAAEEVETGLKNWLKGDLRDSCHLLQCFFPFMWLTTAATPMLEMSKSTLQILQRARSLLPTTGASQALKRSSESQSDENLHFPIVNNGLRTER